MKGRDLTGRNMGKPHQNLQCKVVQFISSSQKHSVFLQLSNSRHSNCHSTLQKLVYKQNHQLLTIKRCLFFTIFHKSIFTS